MRAPAQADHLTDAVPHPTPAALVPTPEAPSLGSLPALVPLVPLIPHEPHAPVPRFHITDDLWNSFTVESVNRSMEALRKRGEIKFPRQFTVRASYKVLTQDIPDLYERWVADWERRTGEKPTSDPRDAEGAQNFYDFTFDFGASGSDDFEIEITQVIKAHRPEIPITYRKKHSEALATEIMRVMHPGMPDYEIIKKQWWEKDWSCTECFVIGPELDEWVEGGMAELAAWMLIVCLHERTVRKVEVEPKRAPQSRIAKKLAARRGEIVTDDAPETILYVPARVYEKGDGTHASPHLHYRNPHWRNQPYGPRDNPTYKEIWIEGVFINAEDCTDAERSEARIKARNFKLVDSQAACAIKKIKEAA